MLELPVLHIEIRKQKPNSKLICIVLKDEIGYNTIAIEETLNQTE